MAPRFQKRQKGGPKTVWNGFPEQEKGTRANADLDKQGNRGPNRHQESYPQGQQPRRVEEEVPKTEKTGRIEDYPRPYGGNSLAKRAEEGTERATYGIDP